LVLIYLGQKWMANREPYNLKRPLLFYGNVGLAVFSTIGTISCAASLVRLSSNMMVLTFYVLKIIELGDTAFIVLRKSPLQFLHWYHHMTALSMMKAL
ncbi:elongation of very long chain fatty acids protein 3-like, partial [Gigantopelta aegis]|uniref:elongation of very long chain fatty acids protein 3-like n=1 Tax=Gigantopelta aegis TaxID=1735272 RepID=UPI001B889117